MLKPTTLVSLLLLGGIGGCSIDFGSTDRAIDDDPFRYEDRKEYCENPNIDLTHPDPPISEWDENGRAPDWLPELSEEYATTARHVAHGVPLTDAEIDVIVAADWLLEDAREGRFERPSQRDLDVLLALEQLNESLFDRLPCVDVVINEVAD